MFKNLFTKKDTVANNIEAIKKIIDDIDKMTDNPSLSEDDYLMNGRIVLNMAIIQTLLGAEFAEPKKEGKGYSLKFNGKLPNRTELAEIVQILNDFIGEVENPFLDDLYSVEAGVDPQEDDMGITDDDYDPVFSTMNNIPTVEKWDKKKLRDYIFGYDGKSAMSKAMLTGMDCIHLAAIGEEMKKKNETKKMLIIGGVVIAIAAGAVTLAVINNKRKKKAEENTFIDEMDDIGVDMDGVDIDDDELTEVADDTDDAPVVEME